MAKNCNKLLRGWRTTPQSPKWKFIFQPDNWWNIQEKAKLTVQPTHYPPTYPPSHPHTHSNALQKNTELQNLAQLPLHWNPMKLAALQQCVRFQCNCNFWSEVYKHSFTKKSHGIRLCGDKLCLDWVWVGGDKLGLDCVQRWKKRNK